LSGATHYGERIYAGSLDDLTPVVRTGYESLPDTKIDSVLTAMRRRDQLLAAIAAVFDEVDVLLTPTVAIPAFVAAGPPPMEIAGQSVGGMGSVPFTAPFNISGMPAVSIPAGISAYGLPIGLQAVTRRHDEELVLACGALAEANRPWPKFAPMAYR
jgi:Asp-tRNA(Asn)/Glu-tRNA(Gln) amidotransferase A subunit family amidase